MCRGEAKISGSSPSPPSQRSSGADADGQVGVSAPPPNFLPLSEPHTQGQDRLRNW